MLTLGARGIDIQSTSEAPRVFRLSSDKDRPLPLRKCEGYLSCNGETPEGFGWLIFIGNTGQHEVNVRSSFICLPPSLGYVRDGDILSVDTARRSASVLFQRSAVHHTFLLTERCNHYCLMCSQPPRDVQDDWLVDDVMAAIPLIDRSTREILFTGGEPTLLGQRLVELVRQSESYLPETALHILSNGRAFGDAAYAAQFAELNHHDLMFGIPIYSDQPDIHDYVVQAQGAFDQTVRGILNLKRQRLRVEIRVVVHQQTFSRLLQLAQFIARNLTFVDQVVFMGLEMTGFTRANLEKLWIDPIDYKDQLKDAVNFLIASRIPTSIYNQQLCVTDRSLWPFARKSISDWKNEYMDECAGCAVRSECGGFFASAKLRYSRHIRAIATTD